MYREWIDVYHELKDVAPFKVLFQYFQQELLTSG
jgi:hypothetical protein